MEISKTIPKWVELKGKIGQNSTSYLICLALGKSNDENQEVSRSRSIK